MLACECGGGGDLLGNGLAPTASPEYYGSGMRFNVYDVRAGGDRCSSLLQVVLFRG